MKRWQNWLVPVLTFLTVFVLALLPRQASLIQDHQLRDGVHSEELASDSNFPFQPPPLAERFDLLARWYLAVQYGEADFAGDVTEVYQQVMEMEDQPEVYRQITQELDALAADGILPEEIPALWREQEFSTNTRVYLRDASSLAGASFLMVDFYDNFYDKYTSTSIQLLLDEESGRVMEAVIYMENIRERLLGGLGMDIPELGEAFLKHLGLEYKLEYFNDDVAASYTLAGSSMGFAVFLTGDMLLLTPRVGETAEPADVSPDVSAAISGSNWKT